MGTVQDETHASMGGMTGSKKVLEVAGKKGMVLYHMYAK
jgi:hypothetical protein